MDKERHTSLELDIPHADMVRLYREGRLTISFDMPSISELSYVPKNKGPRWKEGTTPWYLLPHPGWSVGSFIGLALLILPVYLEKEGILTLNIYVLGICIFVGFLLMFMMPLLGYKHRRVGDILADKEFHDMVIKELVIYYNIDRELVAQYKRPQPLPQKPMFTLEDFLHALRSGSLIYRIKQNKLFMKKWGKWK